MKKIIMVMGLVFIMGILSIPRVSYGNSDSVDKEEIISIAQFYDQASYSQLYSIYEKREMLQKEIKMLIKENPKLKEVFVNKRRAFELKNKRTLDKLDKQIEEGTLSKRKAGEIKRKMWIQYIDTTHHYKKTQEMYKKIYMAKQIGNESYVKQLLQELIIHEGLLNEELSQKVNWIKKMQ